MTSRMSAAQRCRLLCCPVGTGVKQPGPEISHSPPSSAKVKKQWSCTSTIIICLHDLDMLKQTLIAVALAAIECFILSPFPAFLVLCYLSVLLHTDLLHLIPPFLLSLSITIITSYSIPPFVCLFYALSSVN